MVCCCRSTVASGAISQDDLNSQQNYCFSADSCSPFFLGGGCSILLSYGDRVDRQSSFYPFSLRLSIREKEESRRRLSSFGLLYSMTRTRMTLGRWVTSLMTACSTLDPRSTRV